MAKVVQSDARATLSRTGVFLSEESLMSWSYSAVGKPEAVIRNLEETKQPHAGAQWEIAKQLILTELDGFKKGRDEQYARAKETGRAVWGCDGVKVEASGHADTYSRNLRIEVTPINIVE